MNTKELQEWAKRHNVVSRTEEGFREYLDNWKNNDRSEFYQTFKGSSNVKLIHTVIASVQLAHLFENGDYVYCNLNIYYLDWQVGTYKLVFSLDGGEVDDKISFDKIFDNVISDGSVKFNIVRRALKEGCEFGDIAKWVDLDETLLRKLFDKSKEQY